MYTYYEYIDRRKMVLNGTVTVHLPNDQLNIIFTSHTRIDPPFWRCFVVDASEDVPPPSCERPL
jgi:hypothetical protein